MLYGRQRPLEGGHRLLVSRACQRPGPGLSGVVQRFLPHLTPRGVIRQPFDLVAQAVAIEPLARLRDTGMQGAPPFLEENAVGHLVRQGVFEGVGHSGNRLVS